MKTNDSSRSLLKRLVFGRGGPAPERKPITRGQQTAWIIGAMLLVAFLAYNYMETRRDPCASIFQSDGGSCRAAQAAERLRQL